MQPNALPNAFKKGWVHRASVFCPSCKGTREVMGLPCALCNGRGFYDVGCGGPAERDANYPLANCFRCNHLVDPREVTRN